MGWYRTLLGLGLTSICVVPGCANLVGLGGYSVAGSGGASEAGSGNEAGHVSVGGSAGYVGSTAGGAGLLGSAGNGMAMGGASGSGGSACANDCDDGNDCTDDGCVAAKCVHQPVGKGSPCGTGRVCDAQAACALCLDTAGGTSKDQGCPTSAPVCVGTGIEAACEGCLKNEDCQDTNECTTETCTAGKCVIAPESAGKMCATGVCNGAANAEKCVACADSAAGPAQDSGCSPAKPMCDATGTPACGECIVNADCATDNVSCTNEMCVNHVCKHVSDDSKCPPSGDACKPNKCDGTPTCKQVDISVPTSLITASSTLGNGSFEVAGSAQGSAQGWADTGADVVIYNCSPPGCVGSTGTTFTQAGNGNFVAWFGGTTYASVDQISQIIALPAGTTKLSVRADSNVQTKNASAANKDSFEVRLLDSTQKQIAAIATLSNVIAQTGTAHDWTSNGIDAMADVSTQAGKDIYLNLWSSVDASGKTDFFIDNVRVTATVCK